MNHRSFPALRRLLVAILCAVIFVSIASAQSVIGRQNVEQFTYTPWGAKTYGLTYLPSDYYSSNQNYPLIIFLHGTGEGGTGVGGLWHLVSTGLPQIIANGWDPQA